MAHYIEALKLSNNNVDALSSQPSAKHKINTHKHTQFDFVAFCWVESVLRARAAVAQCHSAQLAGDVCAKTAPATTSSVWASRVAMINAHSIV